MEAEVKPEKKTDKKKREPLPTAWPAEEFAETETAPEPKEKQPRPEPKEEPRAGEPQAAESNTSTASPPAQSQPAEGEPDKQRPLPPNPVNPLADEDGVLQGTNFNEQWKIASMMAQSEMVPDAFRGKPAAVLMAMQTAKSRGLNPLTALQSMANLFGRTVAYGELPLAEVFASGKLEKFQEFWIDAEGEEIDARNISTPVFGAVCIAKAKNSPQGEVVRIFTLDDAKTANLLDDPKRKTWRQYTKRMLQMRARGWALKDAAPEVTAGIGMPDYDDHAPETRIEGTAAATGLAGKMNLQLEGGKSDDPVQ